MNQWVDTHCHHHPKNKTTNPTTDEATTKNPNNEKPTQKAGRGSSRLEPSLVA
jgi:hypothetical protein